MGGSEYTIRSPSLQSIFPPTSHPNPKHQHAGSDYSRVSTTRQGTRPTAILQHPSAQRTLPTIADAEPTPVSTNHQHIAGEHTGLALLAAPLGSSLDDEACCELVGNHLTTDAVMVIVTLTQSPSDRLTVYREYGPEDLNVRFELITVDGQKTPTAVDDATDQERNEDITITTVRTAGDLTRLGLTINKRLRAIGPDQPIVVCFHSLTALLQFVEPAIAFRFVHTLNGVIESLNGSIHYHIDATAHTATVMGTFRPLFDTVVDAEELISNKRDSKTVDGAVDQPVVIEYQSPTGPITDVLAVGTGKKTATVPTRDESTLSVDREHPRSPQTTSISHSRWPKKPLPELSDTIDQHAFEQTTASDETPVTADTPKDRGNRNQSTTRDSSLVTENSASSQTMSQLWQWGPSRSSDPSAKRMPATATIEELNQSNTTNLCSVDRDGNEIESAMQIEKRVSSSATLGFFGRTAVGIVLLIVGVSLMLEGETILTALGMMAMGLVPVGIVLSIPTVSLPVLVAGLISLPMIGIGVGGIGIIILCLR